MRAMGLVRRMQAQLGGARASWGHAFMRWTLRVGRQAGAPVAASCAQAQRCCGRAGDVVNQKMCVRVCTLVG